MRLFLQQGGSGGCFPGVGRWWSAAGSDSSLEQLDFVSANPVTPDVVMALMHMAYDVQGIECTMGARRDVRFSHEDVTQVVGVIRSRKSSDFFKNDMAPVLKRSAGGWEELRDASIRLQNQQVGSISADLKVLLKNTSEPSLAQAYAMLLRHSTFDLSALTTINLGYGVEVVFWRNACVALLPLCRCFRRSRVSFACLRAFLRCRAHLAPTLT